MQKPLLDESWSRPGTRLARAFALIVRRLQLGGQARRP